MTAFTDRGGHFRTQSPSPRDGIPLDWHSLISRHLADTGWQISRFTVTIISLSDYGQSHSYVLAAILPAVDRAKSFLSLHARILGSNLRQLTVTYTLKWDVEKFSYRMRIILNWV